MGSTKRSRILFLVGCMALAVLFAAWGGAGLVAGDRLVIGQTGPLIASYQSPLVQDILCRRRRPIHRFHHQYRQYRLRYGRYNGFIGLAMQSH